MKSARKLGADCIKTFAFPVVMWVFFAVVLKLKGSEIFITATSLQDIFQTSVLTTIVALAIALPLSGGRWDFGVGANMILTAIIAGNIAINNQWGLGTLIVLCILVAVLLSMFEGMIYILFRVPNMIVSLGIVMLYEALTGLVFKGEGVRLYMYEDLSVLTRQPYCYVVLAVVLLGFWALMKYTKFGYDSRSLGANATLAVNSGVNEKKNILLTYLVVGVLLGVAALLNASKAVVAPEANLSSTTLMFSSMGPVLVGLFLSRYTNMTLGIFSGSLAMRILAKGLTAYGMPSAVNNIILGIFIVAFMGYTTNMSGIKKWITKRVFQLKSKERAAS